MVRGWTYVTDNATGDTVTIPTASGLLPNFNQIGTEETRRRVQVYRSGVRHYYSTITGANRFYIGVDNDIKFYSTLRGETVLIDVIP